MIPTSSPIPLVYTLTIPYTAKCFISILSTASSTALFCVFLHFYTVFQFYEQPPP